MSFELLAHILNQSLKGFPNLEKRKLEGRVIEGWNDLVGSTLSRHSLPECVRGKTLFIRVSDPIWMQQLQFHKPLLMKKIQEMVGEGIIQDIHLRMGTIPPRMEGEKGPAPARKRLTKKKKGEIEKALSPVNDQELRERLRRLFSKASKFDR